MSGPIPDDVDHERLEAMTAAQLWRLADALGVAGARWLPHAALVRTILTIQKARRLAERVRGIVRDLATAALAVPSIPPPPEHTPSGGLMQPPPPPTTASPEEIPPSALASETIARLYELQGKPAKAEAIREMARRRPTPGPPVHARRRGDDASRVTIALDGDALRLRWEIADRAWRGAEIRLGAAGRPTARIVATAPGRAPATIDTHISEADGEARLPVPPGLFARAAIGLVSADGRFVPAAHSPACKLLEEGM